MSAKKASQLQKWKKNPRKITDTKRLILSDNLEYFGDLSGIVYNVKNNSLVSGHQRSDCLANGEIVITEKFVMPTKSGTVAIGFVMHGDERFNYREVSWDEQTHAAAAIAANKSAGEWDFSMLTKQFEELDNGMFDMSHTGFDSLEIEALMAPVSFDEPDEKKEPEEKHAGLKTCPNCGVMIDG